MNVITGGIPIATNMVRVNRRLIPVDVKNGVFQGSRTGCSHCLADATRCHTSFSFYYVNIRSIITVVVHCPKSKPERCCHTNPRCTGGEAYKRRCRGRMPVECFRTEFFKEGCICNRISAKTQKILQAKLIAIIRREKFRCSNTHYFVTKSPH